MFNLYDCCITWNAFYEANLFTSFNRNKYSQEFQFHCAFSSHYFYLNWLWTCPEQCKHMPPAQRLLCCLPTDDFGICLCYILIRYKSAEGHWCPWKAWAPSTFSQPLSLLLWFPGCCINTQVTGRLENVMSVATPVDEKERAFPWTVFLGTPTNQLQRMNCTDFLSQSSGVWCVILYTVRSDGLLQTTFSSARGCMPTAGA